ncbi:AfsR/SARP family transcriptional regulator [Thermocatellispora tengchongensis]|uniref:AfsR/SARP family transcriptional regulator n=1 Tax=Thermocatellispora tengchongensis TaxID=1073253 RepID=UPI0036452BE8
MGERLRFQVLGPVRAWRGDEEVELGPPQQRAILAVLLLQAGTPASPDRLISAIWGEAAPGRRSAWSARTSPGCAACSNPATRPR